jgi:hypothetical protein
MVPVAEFDVAAYPLIWFHEASLTVSGRLSWLFRPLPGHHVRAGANLVTPGMADLLPITTCIATRTWLRCTTHLPKIATLMLRNEGKRDTYSRAAYRESTNLRNL